MSIKITRTNNLYQEVLKKISELLPINGLMVFIKEKPILQINSHAVAIDILLSQNGIVI